MTKIKTRKPKLLDGKWYIEVETEEFGNVLLLRKTERLPIPVNFDTKEEAKRYLKTIS